VEASRPRPRIVNGKTLLDAAGQAVPGGRRAGSRQDGRQARQGALYREGLPGLPQPHGAPLDTRTRRVRRDACRRCTFAPRLSRVATNLLAGRPPHPRDEGAAPVLIRGLLNQKRTNRERDASQAHDRRGAAGQRRLAVRTADEKWQPDTTCRTVS